MWAEGSANFPTKQSASLIIRRQICVYCTCWVYSNVLVSQECQSPAKKNYVRTVCEKMLNLANSARRLEQQKVLLCFPAIFFPAVQNGLQVTVHGSLRTAKASIVVHWPVSGCRTFVYIYSCCAEERSDRFSEKSVTIHVTLGTTAHKWSSMYIRKAVQL